MLIQTINMCRKIVFVSFSALLLLIVKIKGQHKAVSLLTKQGFIEVNDKIQLSYSTVGNGDDTLVILHGGPGLSFNYLLPDLQPLASNFTLLFYDQRGAGHSSLPQDSTDYAMKWHLDDLEHLRKHFKIKKLNLLGHSWGGLLAGFYAAEYPDNVKRMILVASDPPAREPYWQLFKPSSRLDSSSLARATGFREKWGTTKDSVKRCWDYWGEFIKGYLSDATNARFIWGDVCNMPQATFFNSLRPYSRILLGKWDLTKKLRDVTVRTLVIHGVDDPMPLSGARRWHHELPNSSIIILPKTGHFPHVESPDLFFPLVTRFLQGGQFADSIKISDVPVSNPILNKNNAYSRLFAAIVKQTESFERAVEKQDALSLASLYNKNGELYAPTIPLIKGQRQVAAFWDHVFTKGLKKADLQTIKIEGSEYNLTESGKYKLFGGEGQLLDFGKYIVIWEKVDNQWKIKHDIFNSSMKTLASIYQD